MKKTKKLKNQQKLVDDLKPLIDDLEFNLNERDEFIQFITKENFDNLKKGKDKKEDPDKSDIKDCLLVFAWDTYKMLNNYFKDRGEFYNEDL